MFLSFSSLGWALFETLCGCLSAISLVDRMVCVVRFFSCLFPSMILQLP